MPGILAVAEEIERLEKIVADQQNLIDEAADIISSVFGLVTLRVLQAETEKRPEQVVRKWKTIAKRMNAFLSHAREQAPEG